MGVPYGSSSYTRNWRTELTSGANSTFICFKMHKGCNSNVCCNRRFEGSITRLTFRIAFLWYFSYLHPLRVAAIPRFFVSHGSQSCNREIGLDTPSSCILGRLIRGGAREKKREKEREPKRRLRLLLAEQESSLFVPHAISSNDTWYPPIITVIPWCCDAERTIVRRSFDSATSRRCNVRKLARILLFFFCGTCANNNGARMCILRDCCKINNVSTTRMALQ